MNIFKRIIYGTWAHDICWGALAGRAIVFDDVAVSQVGGLLRGVHAVDGHSALLCSQAVSRKDPPITQIFTQHCRLFIRPGVCTYTTTVLIDTDLNLPPTPFCQAHLHLICWAKQYQTTRERERERQQDHKDLIKLFIYGLLVSKWKQWRVMLKW